MKKILLFPLLCSWTVLSSQISIQSQHLPDANDNLIQQNATIISDFDPAITGANMTWNLGEQDIQPVGAPTTTICVDVSTTPFTFQFLFNNPFDQEHNSDYGIGVDNFSVAGQFTIEDAYQYFQNRSDRFANTGYAASFNGIPLGTQANPVDVIYELPLNFSDQSTSFSETLLNIPTLFTFRQQTNRQNEVDGWGTITIWGQSYNAIRVKTVLSGSDSVYVDAFGFGLNLPRPETIEYKWLTHEFKVPVLQVNVAQGITTSVLTAPIITSVLEVENLSNSVYPNPAQDVLFLKNIQSADKIRISDMSGKSIYSSNAFVPAIDISSFAPGLYLFQLERNSQVFTEKFIVE